MSLSEDTLTDFAERFVGYIQAYNRRMTVETLSELEYGLSHISDEIAEIKLFASGYKADRRNFNTAGN